MQYPFITDGQLVTRFISRLPGLSCGPLYPLPKPHSNASQIGSNHGCQGAVWHKGLIMVKDPENNMFQGRRVIVILLGDKDPADLSKNVFMEALNDPARRQEVDKALDKIVNNLVNIRSHLLTLAEVIICGLFTRPSLPDEVNTLRNYIIDKLKKKEISKENLN